jgi:hypothetical protein
MFLPGSAVTISSYTGRTSPETTRMVAVGIFGRSRWEKTQHGRSADIACQVVGSANYRAQRDDDGSPAI